MWKLCVRSVLTVMVLLAGCAGHAVHQPVRTPHELATAGQYVAAAERLFHQPFLTSADEALLRDASFGRGLDAEVQVAASTVRTLTEFTRLMDVLGKTSEINSILADRKEAVQLAMCRAVTPLAASGEVWLTATTGNFAPCLQDRDYVTAIYSNSLEGIAKYGNEQERQSVKKLVAMVPFPEFAARLPKDLTQHTQYAQRQQEVQKAQPVAAASSQKTAPQKEPVTMLRYGVEVSPSRLDEFAWYFRAIMDEREGARYEAVARDPDVVMFYITFKVFDEIPTYGSRESTERVAYTDCDSFTRDWADMEHGDRFEYRKKVEIIKVVAEGSVRVVSGKESVSIPFGYSTDFESVTCSGYRVLKRGGRAERCSDLFQKNMDEHCASGNEDERTASFLKKIAGNVFSDMLNGLKKIN